MKRAAVIALCLMLLAGLAGLARPLLAADSDKGYLADLISKALSTDASKVSVGAVEGALSSDATIKDIVLSDRDGVWLRLDKVRLIWTRSALLNRRLLIDRLEIGRLEVLRRPLPSDTPASNEPLLPELPVKVEVQAFALKELVLGAPVIGLPARIGASGKAFLGPPSQGLVLDLDARRLDAPGAVSVRLAFAPETGRLDLKLDADEPSGGIVAHAANIPGLPPVKLVLTGNGSLDVFNARLTFVAGPDIGAEGTARLERFGGEQQLKLDLSSRIEGLLPPAIAPVFAGSTGLSGTVRFADGGAVVDGISLLSKLAKLDIAGRYGADQTVDLTMRAAALPNEGGKTKAAGTSLGKLDFTGTVKGPVTGPTIAVSLAVAEADLPYGRFAALDARFAATPSGLVGAAGSMIALDGEGHMRGLALVDAGLAKAVGDRLDFALKGVTAAGGVTRLEALRLVAPGGTIDFSGDIGVSIIAGALSLRVDDLTRLSTLAGRPLSGKAAFHATLSGDPGRRLVNAVLDGEASELHTNLAAFDRLTGPTLKLSGTVRTLESAAISIDHVALAGAAVTVQADGRLGAADTDVTATLTLPELKRADDRLSGRGSARLRLIGHDNRLDAAASIGIADATALGRPVPSLTLDATAADLLGTLSAEAKLAGIVDGKPASGHITLARRIEGGWRLPVLDVLIGSVAVKGALDSDAANLALGRLIITARDLDDLSALALTKLSGSLDVDLKLGSDGGRQSVHLDAHGMRIAAASATIDRLKAMMDLTDLYGAPALNADLALDRAMVGGQTIDTARFIATGTAVASDFRLTAKAAGFDLSGNGRLTPGEPIRLDIASFEAKRDGRRISLASPAALGIDKSGVSIRALTLAVETGRIALSGRAGSTLDLTLDATAVPLGATKIVAPGLDIAGTLDAHARIGGSLSRPIGPWTLKATNLALPQMRAAGIGALNGSASGTLAGDRTSLNATLALPRGGMLSLSGTAPLGRTAPLALEAKGQLDAALANGVLAATGRSLTGRITLDARATGTLLTPNVTGTLDLTGGTASDALQGVQINAIAAHLTARGSDIAIDRLSGTTRNGGTIGAKGNIRVDPAAGFPASVKVMGRRAELVATPFVNAVADLDLDISGPIAQRPRLAGRVTLTSLEVNIAERPSAALRPLDNIRHINAPPPVRRQLAQKDRAARTAKSRRAPPFDATLALTISAPNRAFVRGRGLDAELGGDLAVNGSLSAPIVAGAFELRRGRFSVAGQRLDFSRGRVTFTGDLEPELDFVAQTQASDVTAIVTVSGTASVPNFAFSSQPDLPQDEVLSRILFSKASGALSPIQALQLAQAAAQFSGSGDDAFERLRKSLGVDNLDIQIGASGSPTVGVSRYIGNNLSVGVKTGAKPEESGVTVGIDVTKRLKLQLEGTANGGAGAGIATEIEY